MEQPRPSLKLSLPGVDHATIPTLTAEQVTQIPAELLDFLHKHGQVDDWGDFKIISVQDDRHNFTILSIAAWLKNGRLEHGELKVERRELTGAEAAHDSFTYNPPTHAQDITLIATKETHERFLERLGLYMFSIHAHMQDLQAYICDTIRTEYPVYEAELVALLTAVLEHTDDLGQLDPTLANFVSERMFCLRKILVSNTAVLPLLCKAVSATDRFLALAGRVDHSVLALALTELRKGVEEVDETNALLNVFIEQNTLEEDADQPIQPAPLVTPSTQAKRKRGRPSGVKPQAKAAKLDVAAAESTPTGKGGATTPGVTKLGSSVAPSATPRDGGRRGSSKDPPRSQANIRVGNEPVHTQSSTHPRERRPHPGQSMVISRPGASSSIRSTRPQVDNEYWSVTAAEWADMSDHVKRKFTHAGNICETEAGMVALEPCSACREAGHICEVYTTHANHGNLGKSCARFRIHYGRNNLNCSHSSGGTHGVEDGT
jgi:hypothetical protein